MTVIWSTYAKHSFSDELDFIFLKWNLKEVKKFIELVETIIHELSSGTLQGKVSKKTQIRSIVISKQTTLFFDVNTSEHTIQLLLFWNNQKDPKKLRFMLTNLQ